MSSNPTNTKLQKSLDKGFEIANLIKTAISWNEYKRCRGLAQEYIDSLDPNPHYQELLMQKHLLKCANLKFYCFQHQN